MARPRRVHGTFSGTSPVTSPGASPAASLAHPVGRPSALRPLSVRLVSELSQILSSSWLSVPH
eukprot:9157415-Pyramimonas_sp.AAC.1